MKRKHPLRDPALARGLALVALIAAALCIATYLARLLGGRLPHVTAHISSSIVGGLLLLAAGDLQQRLRAAAGRPLHDNGRVFIAGTAIFTFAQIAEAFAAMTEYPDEGALHRLFGTIALAALPVVLLGAALDAYYVRRFENLPRWPLALCGGLTLLVSVTLVMLVLGVG